VSVNKTKLVIGGIAVVVIAVIAYGVWIFSAVDHQTIGEAQREFSVDCDFKKFRQIMVRKNAAEAIISAGGMKLINQSLDDVSIDTSNDDRPILNAIRGRSQSELSAVKQLTVQINDPSVDADRLTLKQAANVQESSMSVETKSIAPAAQLKSYRTTLDAESSGNSTNVRLTVEMVLDLKVPAMFTDRADREVQSSAEQALKSQEQAMKTFVEKHKDKRLILP